MIKYTIKRLLQLIPTLFALTFIIFFMVRLIPGDPVEIMLGTSVDRSHIEVERERLGLNDPLPEQYVNFVVDALHGDLGTSIVSGKDVGAEIKKRFVPTFILALGGTLVAAVIGVIFGIIAATHHNKFLDNFIMVISLTSVSTPSFFLALILMLVFTVWLGWFPSVWMGTFSWKSMVLPIMTLGTQAVGFMTRTTRSAMLDVINQDYIRTSKSRGIPNKIVVYSHALKNALIPIITAIGLRFGGLLAGATLVETVFSIPGIGRYLVDGVGNRDYPVIQGTVLVLAVTFVVVNTAVDLIYAFVDPRIKYD